MSISTIIGTGATVIQITINQGIYIHGQTGHRLVCWAGAHSACFFYV